jgi:YVTN family beta-propeller protein
MHARIIASFAILVSRVLAIALGTSLAEAAPSSLLLEARIPLGNVAGRIDHLAIDGARRRLYVAELGNNSVGVVDLATNRLIKTVGGFSAPQDVGYEPSTDTLYVANGGDGSVRLLRGDDLQPIGRIDLAGDADNVRIDAAHRRVLVGYGDGALAVIDPLSRRVVADIPLQAHPESFQLSGDDQLAYVNIPDAHEIAVVDLQAKRQTGAWRTGEYSSNFPMMLDSARHELWVAFRSPPKLVAFDLKSGRRLATLDSCGDADDLFADLKRDRIYVSCGAGFIDVWDRNGSPYAKLESVRTVAGARTSLFASDLDRLYLAVRATATEPAAIWVFRSAPQNQ